MYKVNKVLVSVIIPCYNVEKYIVECIQSVLAQTHKQLQIICIDNQSTDQTLTLLTRLAAEHSSVLTLLQESTKGAPAARNRGIQESKGEYIQFLDADDLLDPVKIETQVKLAVQDNFPDIIAGNYLRQSVDGERTNIQVSKNDPWLSLMYTQLGITSSNLFKASSVKLAGGFTPGLKSSQEYDLMFKIMKNRGRVSVDNRNYTIIRERVEGSITQSNRVENMVRYLNMRAEIYTFLEHSLINPSKKAEYTQALFDAIRVCYSYHPGHAVNKYVEFIPRGFVPMVSQTTGRMYIFIFKIFGFETAEKIRKLLGR